ncbi:MAG: head maturation protease, ClpP-related [Methylocystis sp.]
MMNPLFKLYNANRVSSSAFRLVRGYGGDGGAEEEDVPSEELGEGPDGGDVSMESTLYVYGTIGGWDYDGNTVTASKMVKAIAGLKATKDSTLHMRFNSPGGDVFEARAIKTAVEQFPGRTIAHVDALAASAASFLMLGADEVEIAPGAMVMIHNPWGVGVGDAAEMRRTAALLDAVGDDIAKDYKGKTKIATRDIKAMMDAETWMSADEAVDKGFCDRLMSKPSKAKASYDLSAYRNAPKALVEAAEAQTEAEAEAERQKLWAQYQTEREQMEIRLRLLAA